MVKPLSVLLALQAMTLSIVACSAEYGATDAAPDGGDDRAATPPVEVDAGSQEAGSDATAEPPLLTNADFERGCVAWATRSARSADETVERRSGMGACRVCAVTGGSALPFQISQRVLRVPFAPGDRLLAEAFIHAPHDAGASNGTLTRLEFRDVDGGVLDEPSGNSISPSSSWTRTGLVAEVPANTATVDVVIVSIGSQDRCFVVDDVSLEIVR